MRTVYTSLCLTALAALTVSLAGCGTDSSGTTTSTAADTPPPAAADHGDHAGHDHDGDHAGHDHGDQAGHEHPAEGPHGGRLIELGNEEYHAELLHDEDTHTVTIHLLDATGKQPVAVPLPEITIQLFKDGQFAKYTLKAAPSESEGQGATEFTLVDEQLCDTLLHSDQAQGRIQVTIAGKPYTGSIEHSSHGNHDHEGHDYDGDDHAGHQH